MGKTAIVKIMERAAGRPVQVGERVWCNVDLASARDFGGANCVLQFEQEMGKEARVWDPNKVAFTFDDCLPLARRIQHLGWNVQLHMSSAQLIQHAEVIEQLPCRVVVDHMGRLDPRLGTRDPAYPLLCRWIDQGNTWVKLSGPYLNTASGFPWEDAAATARAIAEFAPQRVVWGSDFPHVTERQKPDEACLVELIAQWLPTSQARQLALADNPQELYGF